MSPKQCCAARGALRWMIKELAKRARLTPETIVHFEDGKAVRAKTQKDIQQVFEKEGIIFEEHGNGVRWG